MKVVVFFLLLAVTGAAQTKSFTKAPARVPQPEVSTADPDVRELMSNSQIRVTRIDLDPGKSTPMTRHDYDFIIISLSDSAFEFAGPVNSVNMTMQPNELQVINGHWPHRVVNSGPNPLHLIEIEVKHGISPEHAICGLNAKSCTESRFAYEKSGGYVSGTLFETPFIKLSRVEIDPQAGMPEHSHKSDHVLIPLTEAQLTNSITGGDTNEIECHAGTPSWMQGGMVHQLQNRGTQKVMFLEVECK